MSIVINGIEMPTDHPLWIIVHADGTIEANEVSQSRPVGWQTLLNAAVSVPPHGKLIDASTIWNLLYDYADSIGVSNIVRFDKIMEAAFSNAPTIIPATK